MTRRASVEQDLAEWMSQREATRLGARVPAILSDDETHTRPEELAERLADHLRPDEVSRALAFARHAAEGPEGEPARFKLRSVARLFLEMSCSTAASRIVARAARQDPRTLFETRLAREPDPGERRRLYSEWLDHEEDWAVGRQEIVDLYDAAAAGIGAGSVTDLLSFEHPVRISRVRSVFESGAIEPLDDFVQTSARDWWSRRSAGGGGREMAELLFPGGPADDDPSWAVSRYQSLLARLAGSLGFDPNGAGGLTAARPDDELWPRLGLLPRAGAVLQLGSWPGTRGLGALLAMFGRGLRAAFLADVHGEARSRWSDPAFGYAAETVFRRLLLRRSFRSSCGLTAAPDVLEELRFGEVLAPRLGWTYLSWVLEIPKGEPRDPLERLFLRSTGRPPTVLQRRTAAGRDPFGASVLRGTVLGLLIEERLLSRFGHGWFAEGGALRLLREYWEAEPGETAESVAKTFDLGTIEPTPILDACRSGPR